MISGGDEGVMLYFAYGSDLSWQAMLDWGKANDQFIPPRSTPRPAVLTNHRLCFPEFDPFWRGGVADVVPEAGKSVSGALYEVDERFLNLIDRISNRDTDHHGRETGIRQRTLASVSLYQGGAIVEACLLRLRRAEHTHVPPGRTYLDRLVNAAWSLGLSAMWIMYLRSFATQPPIASPSAPVIRAPALRLSPIGIDHKWPRLRTPNAIIQANRIRPAGDRPVGTAGTKRLCAV
jgi:gamma-glutamylcyclotransferase (GGCT)/AIG2-like uncharacterized protein YtfP